MRERGFGVQEGTLALGASTRGMVGKRGASTGGGTAEAGEVRDGGPSMRRRRLGPRRATPSSLEGERCPKRTSVRFSLERGEGDRAYARATSLGGRLLTTPSSMSRE